MACSCIIIYYQQDLRITVKNDRGRPRLYHLRRWMNSAVKSAGISWTGLSLSMYGPIV